MKYKNLSKLFESSLRVAKPFGPLEINDNDLELLALDDLVNQNNEFVNAFLDGTKNLQEKTTHQPRLVDESLAEIDSTIIIIERMIEWCSRMRDPKKYLFYLQLGTIIFPIGIKLLRLKDKNLQTENSLKWLDRRAKFGISSFEFLKVIGDEVQTEEFKALSSSISIWQAIMMVDYIALPKLFSVSASHQDISDSKIVLEEALLLFIRNEPIRSDIDVNYWRSKAYRHLAMAELKLGYSNQGLFFLGLSTFFARHAKESKSFNELAIELQRGYAEAHLVLGNKVRANSFIENTSFRFEDLAGYIGKSIVNNRVRVPDLKLRLILVRHVERETDAIRKFGFNGRITDHGLEQQKFLLRKLKKSFEKIPELKQLYFVSSEYLENDLVNLIDQLKDNKYKIEKFVTKEFNSIDVGKFRGKTETDAEDLFPGEYRFLHLFRTGQKDGYGIYFPGGENVKDFDLRITISLTKLFEQVCLLSQDGERNIDLSSKIIVLLGHTSTITAIWNLLKEFSRRKLVSPSYSFLSIETGSLMNAEINFTERRFDSEVSSSP